MNYKEVNKGVVKANFTVSVDKWGGFEIRNITLMESNDKRWLAMPSRVYEDDTQKKKYFPYVGFANRELNDKFSSQMMKVLDDHIKTLSPQAIDLPMDMDDLPF